MPLKIVDSLPKLSWGAFIATIILAPFRFRFLLFDRPVPPIWQDYTDFLLFASDIALLLTIFFWFLHLYLRPRKINAGPKFILWPLIGLTTMAALSSIWSIDPLLSFYHSVRLLALFGFYLYVVNNVGSLRQLIAPLGAQIAIQSTIGIAQSIEQKSVGLQLLGEYLLNPAWPGVSVVFTGNERILRAYGLSDHPNILGGLLAFGILALFVYWIYERKWHFLTFAAILLGVLCLFFTYSRSAWLSSLFGFSLILFLTYKNQGPKYFTRGILLLFVIALILLPVVWANREFLGVRLGTNGSFQEIPSEIGSIGERSVLISAANAVFEENALLGVGIGTTPQALLAKFPNFAVNYQPVHFVLLDAAVETGILGAAFYLALLLAPWFAFYLNRRMKFRPDLIATTGVLLSLTIVGFFDYYTWLLAPGRIWQWLAWALWARFYADARANAKS